MPSGCITTTTTAASRATRRGPDLLGAKTALGLTDQYKAFADQCLAEYDLDGWTVPDLSTVEQLGHIKNGILNSRGSAT